MLLNENFATYLRQFSTWERAIADLNAYPQSQSARRLVRELQRLHASPRTVTSGPISIAGSSRDTINGEPGPAPEPLALNRAFATFLNGFSDWDTVRSVIVASRRPEAALKLVERLSRVFPNPALVTTPKQRMEALRGIPAVHVLF